MRHWRCWGVDNGEGVPIPSWIQSLGNVVSSPAGSGADLQPSTAVSIILVVLCWWFWDAWFTLESSTRRLATANRLRIDIHVAKLFGQGRWHSWLCNSFCLIGCSLITTMQNLVTVSHILYAHVSLKKFLARWTPSV